MSKRLIFIGCVYPEDTFNNMIMSGEKVDFAAHRLQKTLLKGFSTIYDKIDIVTAPLVVSYPHSTIKELKNKYFTIGNNIEGYQTGYINLPLIKLISKCLRMKRQIEQLRVDEGTHVIIYAPHNPFIIASLRLLKTKGVKSCLIVPDLPNYMNPQMNWARRIAKKMDVSIMNYLTRHIGSFVLLSPLMMEKFELHGKPWLHMEGALDTSDIPNEMIETKKATEIKTILYTGRADKRYGIALLLEAFSHIETPTYRLIIRGDGDMIEEVQKRSTIDNRIQYVGKLSDKELQKLQREATILINPVPSNEEFTKYFFPSKTMEYLASGTPTLMCRLKCMPCDYEDYVYYIEDESPVGMAEKIKEICEKPKEELIQFGQLARMFVLCKKNAEVQAKRIHQFIETEVTE